MFDKNIKVITCFFHYSQSIVRKMKALKLLKKKLNKKSFCLLLNIQILSFLKEDIIDNYLKLLEKNRMIIKKRNYINIYIIIG